MKTIDIIDAGDKQLGLDAAVVVVLSALFAWLAIRVMMSGWPGRISLFLWYTGWGWAL